MQFETSRLIKTFATIITRIGPFSSMDHEMPFQISFPFESFGADGTVESFVVLVLEDFWSCSLVFQTKTKASISDIYWLCSTIFRLF